MLLTEREVAERLRCSTEKVKRLRLSGKLAYHKGRPVLIDEADLAAYLAATRVEARQRVEPRREAPQKQEKPAPSSAEDGAARARRIWLLRRMRRP